MAIIQETVFLMVARMGSQFYTISANANFVGAGAGNHTKEFFTKNFIKLFGIIVLVAIIGFSMMACDDGSNDNGGGDFIPAKWQGTYGETRFFTVNANGTVSWTGWDVPNGSMSGATIVNGGTGSAPGMTCEWVYLAINGVNRGIITNFTPAVDGYQWLIGMGSGGAAEVLRMMSDYGASGKTLSPYPNISGFPGFPSGNYWFWAAK